MSIPAGATHVVADIYGLSDSGKSMNERYPYRKKDSAGWSAYVEGEWVGVVFGDPSRYQLIDKPWSGPEDGLPPVGTVCEHSTDSNEGDSHDGEWFKVEVIAHHRFQEDDYVCAVWVRDAQISYSSAGYYFRALKMPDQQAAEKRETAIRELMDVAQVDCRVTAARLVDAGFKLPSKSESRDNAVDAMELIVPHIGSVAAGRLYDAGFKREVV